MPDPRLAPTDPADYRYAVHACSFKIDLSYLPDVAIALFRDEAQAKRYGSSLWPNYFEVIDMVTGEPV